MGTLDGMLGEDAAVEVRDVFADDGGEFIGACLCIEAVVEQPPEEAAIEGVELILTQGIANPLETVAQVVLVAIEEAFLLEEIAEHQAVEHERGVVGHDALVGNALDELLEGVLVFLEVGVEFFGEAVAVEVVAQALDDAGDVEGFLLIEGEGDGGEFLE